MAALALALVLPATARASSPDVFGLGSASIARDGAVVASTTGFEAVYYNPAGLAELGHTEVSAGYMLHVSDLQIRGAHRDITDPHGITLGIVRPLPLPGLLRDRVAIGLGLFSLPDTVVRVITRFPDEPFFPYFDNRTQRLVVLPALAVRPFRFLSIGLSVNFFAGLSGPARARDGATRGVETTIFEEIYARAAVIGGLRFTPVPQLALGLAYRQAFYVPYATQTTNLVGGVPLDLGIEARGLFTPHEIAGGAEVRLGRLRAELDFTWAFWSHHPGPFVDVDARIQGVSIRPSLPTELFRDTFSLRAGGEYRLELSPDVQLDLRAGAGFEPSVVRDQPGRTNLVDGDKITVALGAGLRLPRLASVPLRIDVHASWLEMVSRTFRKRVSSLEEAARDPAAIADEDGTLAGVQITNPGYPSISGGGRVLTFGLTLTAELP